MLKILFNMELRSLMSRVAMEAFCVTQCLLYVLYTDAPLAGYQKQIPVASLHFNPIFSKFHRSMAPFIMLLTPPMV